MARSLEGTMFHLCTNNGVTALVSNGVYQNMIRQRIVVADISAARKGDLPGALDAAMQRGLAHIGIKPIFTFADDDRANRSGWLTGGGTLLRRLKEHIVASGGRYRDAVESSFFVPFSNGAELGLHGPEAMARELEYVTTRVDFESTFGITP